MTLPSARGAGDRSSHCFEPTRAPARRELSVAAARE
ncbi:hypothetical protein ABH937_006756 [Kitasatospora sp. GAS1066B]